MVTEGRAADGALESELVNGVTWKIPNPLALVGSRAGDERNGMITSWITQISMEPVLIGIGTLIRCSVGSWRPVW